MENVGSQKLIFRDSRCTDEKATVKPWAKRLTAYHRLHLKHPSVRESGEAAKTKNLTKIWTGTWWRQGHTGENSKNGGEQKGRRWVVKNRLEPLHNLVCSDVAWSSKRLCYHVCVENSFYKRSIPLTSSQRQIFAFLLLVIERHSYMRSDRARPCFEKPTCSISKIA